MAEEKKPEADSTGTGEPFAEAATPPARKPADSDARKESTGEPPAASGGRP
ncbi:hypothetical protein NON00_00520 [Roseomonas sp. GC11]|uniref:hypothetical protein n=1 Tax=Roseomonas sp. GC11 TaxID=2950546 RepID=UPI00210B529A|nr:hypothetical protein [Roseomonas sp. GC11]MCQ4158410.1 hypothetical protein [Roseomonas sp. GC11]